MLKQEPTYTVSNQKDLETTSSIQEPMQLETSEIESTTMNELNSIDQSDSTIEEYNIDNFYEKLHKIFAASGKTVDAIIDAGRVDDEEYVSALYEKLRLAGISDEIINEELNNILRFSLTFTDLDELTWNQLFGNMLTTIEREYNVMDYYYPLAIAKHISDCDLNHHASELDESRLTCDNLEKLNRETMNEMSFSRYVIDKIIDSNDSELMESLLRILNNDIDLDMALNELDQIYTLSQIPMCIDEESYNNLFKNLISTVSEEDNVFMVYGNLARYIHLLTCQYDHYIDEIGTHTCEGLKKLVLE